MHSFWVAPERDRAFAKALKANRVMTVMAASPGKADVGIIGFDVAHQGAAQVLVFPKSLKPFSGAHVVGIKFDLVQQPPAVLATQHEGWTRRSGRKHSRRPPQPTSVAEPAREDRLVPEDVVAAAEESAAPTPPRSARDSGRRHSRARPPRPKGAAPETGATRAPVDTLAARKLTHEIRAAISELHAGKSVAAYHRLQRAVGDA